MFSEISMYVMKSCKDQRDMAKALEPGIPK